MRKELADWIPVFVICLVWLFLGSSTGLSVDQPWSTWCSLLLSCGMAQIGLGLFHNKYWIFFRVIFNYGLTNNFPNPYIATSSFESLLDELGWNAGQFAMKQPNVSFVRVITPSPECLYGCFWDSLGRGSCGCPYAEGVAWTVSVFNACFFGIVRRDEISARWVKGESLLSILLLYRQFRQPTTQRGS